MSGPRLKHVPERTCAACRKKRPQSEFTRLTKVGGVWTVQAGKHRSGRGAYLCGENPACWQEKKLRRAFGTQAPQVSRMFSPVTERPLTEEKSNMGQPMND